MHLGRNLLGLPGVLRPLLVSAAICALALILPAISSAANADFVGEWHDPYTDFTVTSEDAGGACMATSAPGFVISGCQVTGNEYVFVVEQEGTSYKSYNSGTIEGNTAHGFFHDTNGTEVHYVATRTPKPEAVIAGTVEDDRLRPAPGVTLNLTGTSDAEAPVKESTTADSEGRYLFKVPPGNYTVEASGEVTHQNGGVLSVSKVVPQPSCTETKQATCKLPHIAAEARLEANYTYLYCAAKERLTEGKPSTGCPIIFIPGFLGTRIVCEGGAHELWTNIPIVHFEDMALEFDGVTDSTKDSCSQTAAPVPGQEGVVSTAAKKDIYGATLEYINKLTSRGATPAPNHGAYAFTYDWRKSPLITLSALDQEVDEVLEKTKATRVVLMAHSMGGLVAQAYIANPTYAKKVARAITLGTPYWGAPKSDSALLISKSNEPVSEAFGLDLFLFRSNLQLAARNMQGLYWLYPAAQYGPWLEVKGLGFPKGFVDSTAISPLISWLGGTPALLSRATAGHTLYNGITTNEVDYRIVVGTGVPTITSERVNASEFAPGRYVRVWFGSGDGTVPANSASMGATGGPTAPPAGSVPITYACNIDHVSLPGNADIEGEIEGFLLTGEAPKAGVACPYTGIETEIYREAELAEASSAGIEKQARVATANGSMTLEAASAAGLIQLIHNGDKTIVVSDDHDPVTLQLEGKGIALTVRALTSAGKGPGSGSGPTHYYGPLSGNITISPAGAIELGGKRAKATRPAGTIHVSAHVTRRGHRFVVRLTAKGAGVAGIYVRFGHGALKRYRGPLKLTKAQLKKLRFDAVDRFGNWGPAARA